MENVEAIKIILAAAERLARHCEKGDTICFDNEFDEADGEEIREAVAHLTRRAADWALPGSEKTVIANFENGELVSERVIPPSH